MTRISILWTVLFLAGCGQNAPPRPDTEDDAGSALNRQAVAVGLVPDPAEVEFAGRYEARTDIGIDKFCATGNGKKLSVGFLSMSGPESKCEARGTAEIDGDKIRIQLSGGKACAFEASYDGIELRFPGTLESGCASYCSPRTSFSGTHYFMVEPGEKAARNTLGRDMATLCR